MSNRKKLNLYRSYSHRKKPIAWQKILYAGWLPPVLVLVICLAVWGVQLSQRNAVRDSVAELNDWFLDPAVAEPHEESVEKQKYYAELMQEIGQVRELTDNLATYPVVDSALLDRISSVGGAAVTMLITGYDSETGELTFEARSPQVIDIPGYVEKQISTELFRTVDYTGYNYDEDKAEYVLSMQCILMGQEREEQAE